MYQSLPKCFGVKVKFIKENILGLSIKVIKKSTLNSSAFSVNREYIKIGLSLPTQREQRWIKDKESMEKYAKDLGVDLLIENADTSAELQSTQVNNLISKGIKVLILAPTDSFAAASMVDRAKLEGIKVISYDRIINNSDSDLYVSFDNIKIGELQGSYLAENVKKGNYIIMSGDPNDYNSFQIKKGAMKYIAPLVAEREIRIIQDEAILNWNPKNAYEIVKNSLASNQNQVNAILAPNDTTAGGAIQALEEQDLAGKVSVTGQDADLPAIKRILNGTQSMTVFKDTRKLGKIAIDSAIKLAENKPIDSSTKVYNGLYDIPSILLTPIIVTKDNINEALITTGYFNESDIFSDNIKN